MLFCVGCSWNTNVYYIRTHTLFYHCLQHTRDTVGDTVVIFYAFVVNSDKISTPINDDSCKVLYWGHGRIISRWTLDELSLLGVFLYIEHLNQQLFLTLTTNLMFIATFQQLCFLGVILHSISVLRLNVAFIHGLLIEFYHLVESIWGHKCNWIGHKMWSFERSKIIYCLWVKLLEIGMSRLINDMPLFTLLLLLFVSGCWSRGMTMDNADCSCS